MQMGKSLLAEISVQIIYFKSQTQIVSGIYLKLYNVFSKKIQYSFNIVQYRFDSEMLPYCFVVYKKTLKTIEPICFGFEKVYKLKKYWFKKLLVPIQSYPILSVYLFFFNRFIKKSRF